MFQWLMTNLFFFAIFSMSMELHVNSHLKVCLFYYLLDWCFWDVLKNISLFTTGGGGNRAEPWGGNQWPPTGSWQTFPRTDGEVAGTTGLKVNRYIFIHAFHYSEPIYWHSSLFKYLQIFTFTNNLQLLHSYLHSSFTSIISIIWWLFVKKDYSHDFHKIVQHTMSATYHRLCNPRPWPAQQSSSHWRDPWMFSHS